MTRAAWLPQIFTFAILMGCGCPVAGAQDIPVPVPRPDRPAPAPEEKAESPETEPPRIYQAACPALLAGLIKGRIVEAIDKEGCGTLSPVAVTALGKEGEIKLSGETVLNCRMASALADWAMEANGIAEAELKSEISEMATGPGYDCRRRNRAPDGKFSEHAFANALDISSFALSDGKRVTVEDHWPHLSPENDTNEADEDEKEENAPSPSERAKTSEARFLTGVHELACKRFTTVLGPDANASHRSHFHFDLGCHGRDCTYLICE